MAGEWMTICEECPMRDGMYCRAHPGDPPPAMGGCAEPLRMAIAAGYLSVSAMTESMGRGGVDVPMSQNIERIANKMERQ